MNYPASYTSAVSVPLPDDDAIRSVVGDTYDPGTALNVIKMFAGMGDLYPALIGMVNAIFGTKDIDAKHREMIILRAAKVLDTLKSPEYQKKTAADPDHDKYPQFLAMAKRNLKTLFDAGVKIGFGTDSGPPGRFQGYFEHWEMELMVESGLTPMQVITAATKTSAAFLGAKDLGTLEAGKWADLIVLSRNPVDEIKNSRSIEMVMIAGNRI